MGKTMIVTAWNNGSQTYGVKIRKVDRDDFFDKKWATVKIRLPNDTSFIEVELRGSFWRNCIELRHVAIRDWFTETGHDQWKSNHPPKFQLKEIGEAQFSLSLT